MITLYFSINIIRGGTRKKQINVIFVKMIQVCRHDDGTSHAFSFSLIHNNKALLRLQKDAGRIVCITITWFKTYPLRQNSTSRIV